AWRNSLNTRKVADLWAVPEFRQFCRPFGSRKTEPGIVIDFPTDVVAGHNLFTMPLAASNHGYDPSNFATKIAGVAIVLEGYESGYLGGTPRVYLIPAGLDIMTVPGSPTLQTRQWAVADQRIPAPYKTGTADLLNPDWIPVADSLSGTLGQ